MKASSKRTEWILEKLLNEKADRVRAAEALERRRRIDKRGRGCEG